MIAKCIEGIMVDPIQDTSEPIVSPAERYERGLALKQAGLHKAAIDQFELAAVDAHLALKAYAQMGLCYKLSNHYEEAVTAFQKALKGTSASPKETVQILYVLGRTLESLGRVAETLEAYRWIRREDSTYRDVAERIERLSTRRPTQSVKKS
jgi:tetratricopeptide (TPR) repeat protein